jgi:alpha-beta hydrolase superfamily lysophospholipase
MIKYASRLGDKVKIVEIENGRHDLILSEEIPRKRTYNQMRYFLDKLTSKKKH